MDNAYECHRYKENALGKQFSGLFSRHGHRLILKLKNGGSKIYADTRAKDGDPGDQEGTRLHSLAAYFPEIDYALVTVVLYEGSENHLVSMKTGRSTDIGGDPIPSPDGKRIAVSNSDISGYTPNVLSVYRIGADGLDLEFLKKPARWGPEDLRWVTNQEISFNECGRDSRPPYDETRISKTLRYAGKNKKGGRGWTIQ